MIPHPLKVGQAALLGSTLVLNFHLIGSTTRAIDADEAEVAVSRNQLVEILDVVADRDDVRLTFDDGNKSDVTEALPELTRRGLRAEFFICSSRLGAAGFVDKDDLRELQLAGMSVGSHGMDHVPWRRLEHAAIEREIVQAKHVLEDALQATVDAAACPFGAYDRRTLGALRAAGFLRVYTSDGGRAHGTDWLAARTTVRRSDSAESIDRMLHGSDRSPTLVRRAKRWIKRWR